VIRRPEKRYLVNRPVYSEDSFAEDYKKIDRKHRTTLDHVKAQFTCDTQRVKKTVCSLLPIIGWLRIYNIKKWLLGDIVSGISTGLVAVLQGLAYCLLASLPPRYGLFTAFFPVIIYFFLGTSRHISVGAFPVLSLMVGAAVTRLVPDDGPPVNITGFEGLTQDQQRVMVAASATFLMGIFQLAMGLLQVGFIVTYLSDTLISGYTTAAAVHILVSQLKFVFGLTVPGLSGPLSLIYTLEKVFVQIDKTNIASLVISIIVMVVVFIVKELNERFKAKLPVPIPIEVIMTIIICGISYAFQFDQKYQVEIVGDIPPGYEPPMAPNMEVFQQTVGDAFPMAIVGFAVAFSVAKVYAIKHEYHIDGNQELIALGLSNIFGASFKCFAASTALSRTAVQESTGGKTQIAGLLSAIIVMIVTLSIGFLLEPLPKAVLGAVVIVNLKGMLMQVRDVPYLWRKDPPDCMVWILTFVGCLLLGMDFGVAVGLGAELLSVVFRTQFPRCSVLASISGTDIYRDRKDYLNIFEPEGVKVFRIPSPIYFANIDFFRNKLNEYLGFNPLRVLRKRNKALQKIRKLLSKGELQIKGVSCSMPIEESEDEGNLEDLDQPIDFKDLPIQINWNRELPANIIVPKVDVHSLILDFAAVSFIDISALKGLKTTLKELIRIEVEVYIVACDMYILEKLHSCKFFDSEIKSSMFFLTLHDAMLSVLEKDPVDLEHQQRSEKQQPSLSPQVPQPETKF
uniref:Solute carrier family 26 member 3, tandem duplicate 2 n=1 Tax=Scleropages formosus TaxID=113540 RepID=A0A8C9W3Y0_SCLFO